MTCLTNLKCTLLCFMKYSSSDSLCNKLSEVFTIMLTNCIVPKIFKIGLIIPVLKKPTLDANLVNN